MCGLSCSPVVPPGLSAHKCVTAWSASRHLAMCPFCPGCPSPLFLLVWMNVSLTPWLLDLHTVQFSGGSGYFLFLNLLLSFFWLCKEVKYISLHLHLGWKYPPFFYSLHEIPVLEKASSSLIRIRYLCLFFLFLFF